MGQQTGNEVPTVARCFFAQLGRNFGNRRYPVMGHHAPRDMDDRKQSGDILGVYQAFSVYLRHRKRKSHPEQLSRFDEALQPKRPGCQPLRAHFRLNHSSFNYWRSGRDVIGHKCGSPIQHPWNRTAPAETSGSCGHNLPDPFARYTKGVAYTLQGFAALPIKSVVAGRDLGVSSTS
jgi:hypothetical protein